MTVRVGFVGLGRMGAPMAANLREAGFELVVWNRSREKADAFAARADCTAVGSPAEVAERSDVVVSMVAAADALADVYFADPAFLRGLERGIALDMSTIGPLAATDFVARLGAAEVRFVESPVSGSVAAAEAATLTLLVGGSVEDVAAVRGILDAIGDRVLRLGEVGSASLMKLAINSLIYSVNQGLSEALLLADRGGVDLDLAYDAILASAAAAPVMGYRRRQFLEPDDAPVSFALELEEKDMRLTAELAAGLGARLPQFEVNREQVGKALAAGLAGRDIAYIAQHLKQEQAR